MICMWYIATGKSVQIYINLKADKFYKINVGVGLIVFNTKWFIYIREFVKYTILLLQSTLLY